MLYETWFMETKLAELNNETAKVIVPMHIHKKHLKENYNDLSWKHLLLLQAPIFNLSIIRMMKLKMNVQVK